MALNLFKSKKVKSKKSKADDKPATDDAQPAVNKETDKPVHETDRETVENENVASGSSSSPAARTGGFYSRLRRGLEKTRKILTTDVDKLFTAGKRLDEESLDLLEELLITSDIGVKTATELIERLSKEAGRITDTGALKAEMKKIILSCFPGESETAQTEHAHSHKPLVIMVVGVNGVGKTTTIGKLAARYAGNGKKVLFAAADTFRAAAIEQLSIWAERTGAEIVKHRENSDPAAVAYDAVNAAVARDIDVVIVDTAGRLHTRVNLMEELKKIKRSIAKALPGAPHETLLVLDATTGQNALSQTELFGKATDVTGIVITKLDGTAKGGIIINLSRTFAIPIKYIGVGEQVQDLQPFDPHTFVEALF